MSETENPSPASGPLLPERPDETQTTGPSPANWGPGLAIGGAVAAVIAGVLLGIPAVAIDGDAGTDESAPAANIILQLATVIGFLLVPILVATRANLDIDLDTVRRRLGLVGFESSAIGWMFAAYFGYIVFAGLYSTLVEIPDQEDIADFFGPIGFQIALIVFAASISEEICFRGMVYGGLRNGLGVLPAALISGAVFGGLHALTGISAVPVLIGLGVALALLYEKTGSIVPGIILHAINNSLALAVA